MLGQVLHITRHIIVVHRQAAYRRHERRLIGHFVLLFYCEYDDAASHIAIIIFARYSLQLFH